MSYEFSGNLASKAVSVGLAASLMVGACSAENKPEEVMPAPAFTEVETCINPTAEDISYTHMLLKLPQNPVFGPIKGSKGGEGPLRTEQILAYQEAANRYGVTIFNGDQIVNEFYDAYDETRGFDEYFEAATNFMAQLGVTLEVGAVEQGYEYGGYAPSSDDLESDSAKQLMLNIIGAFSHFPKELVELSKFSRIVIISGTASQEVGGYADTSSGGTIYLDVEKASPVPSVSPQGVLHEFMHMLDAAQCGTDDMFNDPAFDSLNGDRQLYNTGVRVDSTYLSYMSDVVPLYRDPFVRRDEAYTNGDIETYCAYEQQFEEIYSEVIAYSDYHPNPAEDKAALGSVMLSPDEYVEFADEKYTLLYPKLRFLLARLYAQAPNIAEFIAHTSRRPMQDSSSTVNC